MARKRPKKAKRGHLPKKKAETWGALAKRLRFSPSAFDLWRRKFPDAPDEPDPDKWAAFIEVNGLGVAGNRVSPKREQLLEASVERKNRLLDLEIAREERAVMKTADVDALLLRIGSLEKAILFAALEGELPARAVGKTAEEIRMIGRDIGDRICQAFRDGEEEWRST